jgi:zinc protease
MNKIRQNGPTDVDLNKVKETLLRDRETLVKENSFWLSYLQNRYLYGDKLLTLKEYEDFVNAFTKNDIKAIADKYLNTKSYVEVVLTPAEQVKEEK